MENARILVVEDESIVAKDIQSCLQSLGYSVPAVVSSGTEAIKKAEETNPDLVLMDIVLKGRMDGVEAAEQMRDRFHIPVIFLTAYTDEETLRRAKTTEPFGYILKPFQERELHTTIKMALYKSQMEKKLRESHEWLSTTLKSIGDAVIITDKKGCVTFMNPMAESLTGWRQEEASGKNLKEVFRIIDEETSEVVENPITKVIREGAAVGLVNHTLLIAKNGTEISIDDCGAPIRNDQGQIVGAVLVFHDITEHKRTEEQIQRSLRHLAVLREIDLAINSTLDLHTVLSILLEKIEQLLAYPAATTVRLFNRDTAELEPVACRNLDEVEWKRDGWRSGRGVSQLVFETKTPLILSNVQTNPGISQPNYFRKHGLVSYLGVPLIAKGKPLGVLGFHTKKEHAFSNDEIELFSTLASQAALAIFNSQLYEQSKKQAVELELANKVKDEFLSLISHELRTPVTVIMGYMRVLHDKMLGDINQKQEEALRNSLRYCNDLLGMITSILEVRRMEAEDVQMQNQLVSLDDILEDLRSVYDVPLNNEVSLIWDHSSKLSPIRTDAGKLRHVLQNLINNAIKFTEKGNVTISARSLPETRAAEFKVTDTGIGIPKEALPFIFEMFRQVDGSESRTHGGVGLGLYIVKKFTEMLGGKIEVQSEPGKGSTFTVTIPYEKQAPALILPPKTEPSLRSARD